MTTRNEIISELRHLDAALYAAERINLDWLTPKSAERFIAAMKIWSADAERCADHMPEDPELVDRLVVLLNRSAALHDKFMGAGQTRH